MLIGLSGQLETERRGRSIGEGRRRTWAARPAWLGRRSWPAVAIMAGIAVLFYCAQRQARQMGAQSDGAALALQAWAMLHGNLLLHGWYLSDVSFYTTELPEYMLVELFRGLNTDVVRLCAALTYTLIVVLAAAVAYGGRPADRRAAAVRAGITVAIMLGPTVAAASTLLNDPDHTGTAVPILLALLILDRARRRWWVPVVVAAVLGWALVGDTLVLLIGVAPLVVVCGARSFSLLALRRVPFAAARYELLLAAAGVAAAVGGTALSLLIRARGGFVVAPEGAHHVVGVAIIGSNALTTLKNFLSLFSADFFGARLDDWLLVTVVHLVFAVLVAGALVLALRGFGGGFRRDFHLRRTPRPDSADSSVIGAPVIGAPVIDAPVIDAPVIDTSGGGDLIAELLAVAIVINLLGYLLFYVGSIGTVREIAPVFGLGGALAGRLLGAPLLRRRLEPLLAIGAVAAIAVLVPPLVSVRPAAPYAISLARFLSAHHLQNGMSGYWNADSTTLDTGDRVIMRSVQFSPGRGLTVYWWEVDAQLLNSQANDVNFLVATGPVAHSASTVTAAEATAQFGRPSQQYYYRGYVIMVWPKNLLSGLTSSSP
jgi:hypothetical protein